MFRHQLHILRENLRDHPSTLYVFGDNLERRGLRGQAREMRGEPNAVGIATKRAPTATGFLSDDDYDEWFVSTVQAQLLLFNHEGDVVWPRLGIGTGFAQLDKKAPKIAKMIGCIKRQLETIHNV